MEQGGKLSIQNMSDNNIIKIIIRDTGNGIETARLDKIFKPFYTTKHKGTGLGLAISKRIVDQHDGSLDCESEIGIGTKFIINLPQEDITV